MSKDSSKHRTKPESSSESTGKKIVRWGPVATVLVTVGIFFSGQLITGIVIGLYGQARGFSGDQIGNLISNSTTWQFTLNLIFPISSLLLLWLFLQKRAIKWSDLGVKKPSLSNLIYGFPIFILFLIGLSVVMQAVNLLLPGIDLQQKQDIGFDPASYGNELILIFISLVIITPIFEEILTRGFLYGGLKNGMPKLQAALITSFLFAIVHLQLGNGASPLWSAAIMTFLLSMLLVWLRERTGNIWAGVVVHMLKNGFAFISLFILHIS